MYTPLRFINYNIDCQAKRYQYPKYGKRRAIERDT